MIRFQVRLLATAATTALLIAPAAGQSVSEAPSPTPAATADSGDTDDIIVTAQKREERLSDVPISIQAFTGPALERSGVHELSELIRFIPGASEGISNAYGFRSYQIRGTGVQTGDSTTGYYLDDAAFSLIGTNTAPVGRTYDVDRVEVLRGPQGTLYGLSSLGGTIRFITADPDLNDFHVRGQAGYSFTHGGDDNCYGDAALSVPIISDKVGARATVDYEKRGGYVEVTDFPGRKNLDDADIFNFRGKILIQPTEAIRARLTYQHSRAKQDFGTLLVSADPPLITQGSSAGEGSVLNEYDLYSGAISFDLGGVRLESTTGYIDYKLGQRLFLTFFGGPLAVTQGGVAPTFSQEVRLVSDSDGPIDYVIGGFYKDSKIKNLITYRGPLNLDLSTKSRSENSAIFGEVSTKLFDGKLVPLVGGRYSRDKRSTNQNGAPQAKTFREFTPRFNLAYKPSDRQNYYINIARGARSGQFNNPVLVPILNGLGIPAQASIGSDAIWSYEVGTKGNVIDGVLDYNFAVYHTNWTDVQIFVSAAPGLSGAFNGGTARGTGFDYGLTLRASKALSFSLTGNINDTKLHNVPGYVADASPTDGIYNGARLPFVPKFTNTVAVNYEAPINNELDFVGYASLSHSSGQHDATTQRRTSRLDIASARIGVRRGPLSAMIFGENLLDEKGSTYDSPPYINRNYPRVIGLQLGFDY